MKTKLAAPPLPKKFCRECGREIIYSKPYCKNWDEDTGKPTSIQVDARCSKWINTENKHFESTLVYAPDQAKIHNTGQVLDSRHWYRKTDRSTYVEWHDITAVDKLVTDAKNNGTVEYPDTSEEKDNEK